MLTLVHRGEMDLVNLVAKLTEGPASVLGRAPATLRPGSAADIVIFDPDHNWMVDTGIERVDKQRIDEIARSQRDQLVKLEIQTRKAVDIMPAGYFFPCENVLESAHLFLVAVPGCEPRGFGLHEQSHLKKAPHELRIEVPPRKLKMDSSMKSEPSLR